MSWANLGRWHYLIAAVGSLLVRQGPVGNKKGTEARWGKGHVSSLSWFASRGALEAPAGSWQLAADKKALEKDSYCMRARSSILWRWAMLSVRSG